MFKNKSILWLFSALAGINLGILVYSYKIWTSNIPIEFIGYWFGMENFMTVFIVTIFILILYLIYLTIAFKHSALKKSLKLKILAVILLTTFAAQYGLIYSQFYREVSQVEYEGFP